MNNEQNNKTFCLGLNVLKNKIEWSKGFGAFMTSIPFSNVIIVFLSSWDEITTLCSLKMKTSPISMITIQLDKCKGHIHLFWSLAMSSFNVGGYDESVVWKNPSNLQGRKSLTVENAFSRWSSKWSNIFRNGT